MMDLLTIIWMWLASITLAPLVLRKVHLHTTTLGNNSASFINVTARRLHIIIARVVIRGTATAVQIGDRATASLDEVPVSQMDTDDSRSHILDANYEVGGGTGGLAATANNHSVLRFQRNELVLDPDEALFLNTIDNVGAPVLSHDVDLWYDD